MIKLHWKTESVNVRSKLAMRQRGGIGMMEVIIATVIVGVLMVAALRALGAAVRANMFIANQAKALMLADELLSEIVQTNYNDPDADDRIGRELGENGASRSAFDDVDDYDTWSSSPPTDRNGTVKSDYSGWGRRVDVGYVDKNDPNGEFLSPTAKSGVKKIRVKVLFNGEELVRLESLQTEKWFSALAAADATDPDPIPIFNEPPRAEFRADKVVGARPLDVSLDGTFSSDPEGEVLAFNWSVDGVESVGTSDRNVSFATQGVHTVILRVVDERGAQDAFQMWFFVE